MDIFDAQVHLLSPRGDAAAEMTEDQMCDASVQMTVAAMDAVGVRGALVQWWRKDTDAVVARCPDRFAAVPFAGWPDDEPADAERYIADLAAAGGTVGTRFVLSAPSRSPGRAQQLDGSRLRMLHEGAFDAYLDASARHGLAVFVTACGSLPALHDTLRAHPDVTFVLDHLGLEFPILTQKAWPEIFDDLPHVLELAKFPNVAVKVTAAPSLSLEGYPFADLWPRLHRMIDAFSLERLMWGSDFTRCTSMHTYREAVDYLLLTDELSRSDKEMMFGGTMRRLLGWPR